MKKLAITLCLIASTAFANPLVPAKRAAPKMTPAAVKRGYAMWQVPVGVKFFRNLPPLNRQMTGVLSVSVSPGETTSVIVGFYAPRDKGCIRLFPDANKFDISVRHVLFQGRVVPPIRGKGTRIGIPFYLPLEQEAELRARENTVYWLTLTVPADMTPGEHTVTLKLGMQEIDRAFNKDAGDKALATQRYAGLYKTIPLEITVLPFKLPASKRAYGLYTVGGRRPDWAWTPEYERLCSEDLAAYGHNSATTGSWVTDTGFTKTGKVRLKGSELERRIELRMKAGLLNPDIPFLFFGSSPSDCGSHEKFYEFSRQLVAAFKERGWPEPLLYGPDEPGPKAVEGGIGDALLGVQEYARTATAMKGHGVTEYDLGKYFSVWLVMARTFSPEIVKRAAAEGKELWTYDCYRRGTHMRWHRYYPGVYTWAHKLRGNFIWAYTHTPGCSWEGDRTDHRGMSSPSRAGPIAMVGMPARREGIRDARTLTYLESLCTPASGPVAVKARAWLDKLRASVPYRAHTGTKGSVVVQPHSPFWWDNTDLLDPWPAGPSMASVREKAEKFIIELGG